MWPIYIYRNDPKEITFALTCKFHWCGRDVNTHVTLVSVYAILTKGTQLMIHWTIHSAISSLWFMTTLTCVLCRSVHLSGSRHRGAQRGLHPDGDHVRPGRHRGIPHGVGRDPRTALPAHVRHQRHLRWGSCCIAKCLGIKITQAYNIVLMVTHSRFQVKQKIICLQILYTYLIDLPIIINIDQPLFSDPIYMQMCLLGLTPWNVHSPFWGGPDIYYNRYITTEWKKHTFSY